ncbi:MAG: energy-coupling factor ABC transporter ATP-binding protein [Ethanoligenens sp.]
MISIEHVQYTYENSSSGCLKDFSLQIPSGQCVLLTGSSGCGKTTVTRLINGLIPSFFEGTFSGQVFLDGVERSEWSSDALAAKVGSVFQNPRSQFFNLDTTSEIAFGCENMGLSRAELHTRVRRAAADLKLEYLLGRDIFSLSGGEKQMIAIASVYAMNPDIYVLDEPSANLDMEAIDKLRKILIHLKQRGKTILIAEHRLHYLRGVAERIVYMRDGCVLHDWAAAMFEALSGVEQKKLGLRAFDLYRCVLPPKTVKNRPDGGIDVVHIKAGYRHQKSVLRDFSIQAGKGEIVAVVGRNGQGKSTFAKCLCGLIKEKSGTVFYEHVRYPCRSRAGEVYMVMQEPGYQLFAASVRDELQVSLHHRLPDGGTTSRAQHILERMGLREKEEQHPLNLSGGEKQRLAIAAGLMQDTQIFFLDEPTSGLDYGNMQRVVSVLQDLKQQGCIVFIITHDYEFLLAVCDRLIVVENGKAVDSFPLTQATISSLRELFLMQEEIHDVNK